VTFFVLRLLHLVLHSSSVKIPWKRANSNDEHDQYGRVYRSPRRARICFHSVGQSTILASTETREKKKGKAVRKRKSSVKRDRKRERERERERERKRKRRSTKDNAFPSLAPTASTLMLFSSAFPRPRLHNGDIFLVHGKIPSIPQSICCNNGS